MEKASKQLSDLIHTVTKGRGRGRPKLRMQTAPTQAQETQNPSGVIQGATGAQYTFMDTSPKDMVNSPEHYRVGGIETIDFIEAKNLGYNLGNVVKYVSRARYKVGLLEDLKKAEWYLKREIASIERNGQK